VSQFNPTSRTIYPPPDADAAGQALLRALARPIGARQSWPVARSLVVSVITFGVAPIFAWVRGFRTFAVAEQQQFLHLAKWLRQSSAHPLAKRLEEDAGQLRPRGWISWLAILVVAATAAGMLSVIRGGGWEGEGVFHAAVAGTYGFRKSHLADYRVWPLPTADAGRMFMIWIWGLSAAYGLHWLQVQLHAADVRRLVARFSEIAQSEGLHKVRAASLGLPVAPLWFVAGVLMVMMQAPWGLAAMLAGGAHRRYITWTNWHTRAELAQRVRAMMIRRGAAPVVTHGAVPPVPAAPVPVYLRQRCVQPMCRAELPRGANFCRRCGARQKDSVNRVA
jgi:hypothetical protein